MAAVVLLSETNPSSATLFDRTLNPLTQLESWYPALTAGVEWNEDAERLADPECFGRFIVVVARAANRAGARLIVRDYNYVDYFGVPFVTQPQLSSSLRGALNPLFHLQSAVLVRHPLAQYDSLRSHRSAEDALTPEIYLTGYASFLDDFAASYFFKYEDIVAEPMATIEALCRFLDVPYDRGFIEQFPNYHAVTGNLRRQDDPTISHAFHSARTDEWRERLRAAPDYHALLERLDYRDEDAGRQPAFPANPSNSRQRLSVKVAAQEREIEGLRDTVARWERRFRDAPWDATIHELRAVCDERLAVIGDQVQSLLDLRAAYEGQIADLTTAADARLRERETATAALDASMRHAQELERICSDRLTLIEEQQRTIEALQLTLRQNDEATARAAQLQLDADERLALLQEVTEALTVTRELVVSLSRICDDRLAIVEQQSTAFEELRRENAMLMRTCQERLDLIEEQARVAGAHVMGAAGPSM